MFRKKILVFFAALTILLSAMPATMPAYASSGNSGTNFFSGLVQFIAQKLGLDQNKVESVITEYKNQNRQKMQAEMQEKEQERLNNLVEKGEITAEQKQKILDAMTVLHEKYNPENSKDMTAEERKQQFENRQNDIKAWSESTGIDSKYLMMGPRMDGHGGPRGDIGKGGRITPTPAP